MDKASKNSIQSSPQEAYPNYISLKQFTNLNTTNDTKEYNLIIKFLVGKRPGGF
jgi:hypothetical protein